MRRDKILELLEKEHEHVRENAEKAAVGLADRDYKTYDFLKDYYRFSDKNGNWFLWFAYWLGREHGRDTAINNARLYLKDDKEPIIKSFLRSLWVIP